MNAENRYKGVIIININNLNNGMEIKNYKELCKVLNMKPLTSNSKKAQLKELECYCKFHTEGHKYIIDKIYKEPKQSIDKRLEGNNNIYIQEISNIILEYLYNNTDDYSCILSLGQLMEALGIVNKTYNIGNRHKKELSQVLDLNLLSIYYFYSNTRNEFKKIVERSLKNLQKRRIIDWQYKIMICKKDSEGNKYYTLANEKEQSNIIDIEHQALKYFQADNLRDIVFSGKMKEYQNTIKKELFKDWVYYFHAYEIIVGKRAIKSEYEDIQKQKLILNTKVKNKSYKLFEKHNEFNIHKQLADILVDIIKYDFEIDSAINDQYKLNLLQKTAETIQLENNLDNMRVLGLEEIENKYSDEIDIGEYITYIKDKKE